LFAAFFFIMMRIGCGTHMVRGGHGKYDHKDGSDVKHIDPVCGVQISPAEGYGKTHDGWLFRFCSGTCLDKFEADPRIF
jgi:YHS domain-containing protein